MVSFMKKLAILIGSIAFLILLIFVINNSGSVETGTLDDEQLIDALRVGVHYDIKGMGYRRYYDDELSGYEIDLAKQIAKHIYGKESLIELTPVSNKTAKYYLAKNNIDCIIATQTADEKSEDCKYSIPYYTDYIEIMYVNGNIMSVNDLQGKKIGIIPNSDASTKLISVLESANIEIQQMEYESYTDGIDAVNTGRIDAFCTNRVFVSSTNIKRFTIGDVKYSIAVRPDDKELLNKINEAIEYLNESGELKQLYDTYK